MIVLFTDYGVAGPYTGQLQVVLRNQAPTVPVIDLCADVPRQNPKAGAYLLAALHASLPQPMVWLCVVDPGVGSWVDRPLMLQVDGCWFVGPDNGLFDIVGARASQCAGFEISWRPSALSASFHGRDLYAPVAAELALGRRPAADACDWQPRRDWPQDLNEIIYADSFGNALTGMRAAKLDAEARLIIKGRSLQRAGTFADVPPGTAFWYENSNGLVEIAVNQGSAMAALELTIGTSFMIDLNAG